jgi:hypothetical protein
MLQTLSTKSQQCPDEIGALWGLFNCLFSAADSGAVAPAGDLEAELGSCGLWSPDRQGLWGVGMGMASGPSDTLTS